MSVVTADEAIARLDVWQEHVDPCEKGHVDHGASDHLGRRLVHSMARGFGADWDEAAVHEVLRSAERIHAGANAIVAVFHEKGRERIVSFAAKRES